jgi:transglutaminase-like putative cysteine protease
MDRRAFFKIGAASAVALRFDPGVAHAAAPNGAPWRTFEITMTVEVQDPRGPTRVWVPLPLAVDTDYHRTLDTTWRAPDAAVAAVKDPVYGAAFVLAEWSAGRTPFLEVKSRFSTRDRAVDLLASPSSARLDSATRALFTAPTKLIPTDGVVAATAREILKGVKGGDVDRARAIYEWVCDNTFRDAKVRGCGLGDIKSMLEAHAMGGKCADINSLFVGLARASGIAARDVYGVRVADSARGYKALGKSGDVTKAQHCRAEFFADGVGWVPVDPGDVRKVMLEEPPGNLAADDAKVKAARQFLFGAWEMNWLPFNFGHDVSLPGSKRGTIPFLMYPQGETGDVRKDSLDPPSFRYQITAREPGVE